MFNDSKSQQLHQSNCLGNVNNQFATPVQSVTTQSSTPCSMQSTENDQQTGIVMPHSTVNNQFNQVKSYQCKVCKKEFVRKNYKDKHEKNNITKYNITL